MKFRTYRENGALNSPPIFDAFEQGLRSAGHEISKDHDAIPVIWSVLWNGRMAANRLIYEQAVRIRKPIVIIEVGNFLRGKTWRISLNHVNNLGIFGNDNDLDLSRNEKFQINLKSVQTTRKPEILIACQHQKSLQWQGQSSIDQWVKSTISKIRQFSDRPIVVRPHPRSPFVFQEKDVIFEKPKLIPNTYDDFDINYNYHCVVNHNSGVPVQAAINGIPTICDQSCLAYPVSMAYEDLNNPVLPERESWLTKMLHTEWFVDEIQQGIPIKRLEKYLI
jgi:hypothetical protein